MIDIISIVLAEPAFSLYTPLAAGERRILEETHVIQRNMQPTDEHIEASIGRWNGFEGGFSSPLI